MYLRISFIVDFIVFWDIFINDLFKNYFMVCIKLIYFCYFYILLKFLFYLLMVLV